METRHLSRGYASKGTFHFTTTSGQTKNSLLQRLKVMMKKVKWAAIHLRKILHESGGDENWEISCQAWCRKQIITVQCVKQRDGVPYWLLIMEMTQMKIYFWSCCEDHICQIYVVWKQEVRGLIYRRILPCRLPLVLDTLQNQCCNFAKRTSRSF